MFTFIKDKIYQRATVYFDILYWVIAGHMQFGF